MSKIFAYGTLNLAQTQWGLWGETKQGKVAKLNDYRLRMYPSCIFYIEKEFGETVAGKIYDLNSEQLNATDEYEGDAYERKLVKIDKENVYVYVKKEIKNEFK